MGVLDYLQRTKQMQRNYEQTGSFNPPEPSTPPLGATSGDDPTSQWGPILDEHSVAAPIPADDAVRATGQVVRVVRNAGVVNLDPVLEVQLLVLTPGNLPRPLSTNLRVPLGQVPKVHPGASIPLTTSVSDLGKATLDSTPA